MQSILIAYTIGSTEKTSLILQGLFHKKKALVNLNSFFHLDQETDKDNWISCAFTPFCIYHSNEFNI